MTILRAVFKHQDMQKELLVELPSSTTIGSLEEEVLDNLKILLRGDIEMIMVTSVRPATQKGGR